VLLVDRPALACQAAGLLGAAIHLVGRVDPLRRFHGEQEIARGDRDHPRR
jgi:hypothetical protein